MEPRAPGFKIWLKDPIATQVPRSEGSLLKRGTPTCSPSAALRLGVCPYTCS